MELDEMAAPKSQNFNILIFDPIKSKNKVFNKSAKLIVKNYMSKSSTRGTQTVLHSLKNN